MHCRWNLVETWNETEAIGHALLCKRWTCPTCVAMRCAQLREQAASGNPTTFLTLTSKVIEGKDPALAARELVHAWRMIVQRGRREKLFDKLPYLAVFEETKQGWPHLHILLRAPFISQRWLSARMEQYAGSPIVDIRKVDSAKHAAWYIAKYVSKAAWRWEGCKRYWSTRDWRQVEKLWATVADPLRRSWAIIERFWFMRIEELRRKGYHVEATGAYSYRATVDPPDDAPTVMEEALGP